MCGQCAMVAMSGAGGLRVWLQTRDWTWLTRKRLRRITIAAFAVATVAASVGFS